MYVLWNNWIIKMVNNSGGNVTFANVDQKVMNSLS